MIMEQVAIPGINKNIFCKTAIPKGEECLYYSQDQDK